MGIINDIFRTYGPEYLQHYEQSMPREHKKTIEAICQCRTEAYGSVCYQCEDCGHRHLVPAACGNRHCPGCQHRKSQQWLERQLQRQLPGHHFMLTFTVPEPLRAFLRSHQQLGYDALFQASSQAIKTLVRDPRFLNADQAGFFGVLHTWGRQLQYHPHIHYVVPGGALSAEDGAWHASSLAFFLPVKALSRLFRGKFRASHAQGRTARSNPLRELAAGLERQLPGRTQCRGFDRLSRPLRLQGGHLGSPHPQGRGERVSFSYKKPGSARLRTLTLDALEFIRRFLQHVLPKGFMKVRYYGFLSPTAKVPLEELKAKVELAHGFTVTVPEDRATPLATTGLPGLWGTTALPQLTAHPPPPMDAHKRRTTRLDTIPRPWVAHSHLQTPALQRPVFSSGHGLPLPASPNSHPERHHKPFLNPIRYPTPRSDRPLLRLSPAPDAHSHHITHPSPKQSP